MHPFLYLSLKKQAWGKDDGSYYRWASKMPEATDNFCGFRNNQVDPA